MHEEIVWVAIYEVADPVFTFNRERVLFEGSGATEVWAFDTEGRRSATYERQLDGSFKLCK